MPARTTLDRGSVACFRIRGLADWQFVVAADRLSAATSSQFAKIFSRIEQAMRMNERFPVQLLAAAYSSVYSAARAPQNGGEDLLHRGEYQCAKYRLMASGPYFFQTLALLRMARTRKEIYA